MYSQYAIYWRFGKFRKRDKYDYRLVRSQISAQNANKYASLIKFIHFVLTTR